jgi:tol-pal system protein YbgF
MNKPSVPVSLIAGILLTLSANLLAAPGMSIEQRLVRVENMLGNQVMMEQMQQMEQIRAELAEIRGLVENQDHQFKMIKQRQRNLYNDMDRRLHELEVGTIRKPKSLASSRQPMPTGSSIAPPVSSKVMPVVVATTNNSQDQHGQLAYSQAFKVLKEGNYQQAIIDFKSFIATYQKSKYVANAQYWLGEANYASRDYKTALEEFNKIKVNYPKSRKIQDAELKIGYTYFEMKDWASAKAALELVISNHPDSIVAKKAKERLVRMKREVR